MTENNTVSISELQQKANVGDAQAQFELAACYAEGKVIEENKELAFQWLNKSAEHGFSRAQLTLGLLFFIKIENESTMEYLEDWNRAADHYLMFPYINKEDTKRASWVLRLFSAWKLDVNDARYINILDSFLSNALMGGIIPGPYTDLPVEDKLQDAGDLAFYWLKRAAEQDCPQSQFWLSLCYRFGIGISQNEESAFRWLKNAAEHGIAKMQYRLAQCYFDGIGVPQNNELAVEWYKKAGDQGVSDAQFWLAQCYFNGKGVEENKEQAIDLLENLAEKGHAEAAMQLAECYAQGLGVEKSDELALKWYEKAAEKGNEEAQYRLARIYLEENGAEQNPKKGMKWLVEAIKSNHDQAYQWLENTYLNFIFPYFSGREDIEQCYKFAFEWLSREYEESPEDSEINFGLGALYAFGKGVEKSQKHAIEYFYKFESGCGIDLPNPNGYNLMDGFSILFCIIYKHENRSLGFLDQIAPSFIEKQYIDWLTGKPVVVLPRLREDFYLKEKTHKALQEKEKEMLSFFTHTMRNALATAPESLRQAIHLLGGEVYEKDTKHYQAINKIASLFSTLSLTDCLIDTFKQSISDPQEFKQSWQKDHTGEATPKWVIASALRQSLNRIIFMSDTTELRKLLNNPETALIKATRKSFIEEVLPLNVDSLGVDVFYAWTDKHISAIDVSIADCDKLNFGVNQIRFSLLFAITSELILNALKYWDGENRIQISWQLAEQDNYVFSVKNHCKANATSNLAGTHKGLAFIKRLVELLGEQAQFVCKSEDQLFTAELILNKALFKGES